MSWNTPRHIVIKLTKIKDRDKILKATREKQQITYKGTPIKLSADFSTETLQARREWHDIFKVMKEKNLQPRIFYPARLSFRFDGEIKSFSDKQKLREFSTTKPALQQMLEELLQAGNKREGKDLQKIDPIKTIQKTLIGLYMLIITLNVNGLNAPIKRHGLMKTCACIFFHLPHHSASVQLSSVAQLCLTFCGPMDCRTPGFPVHHQLLESTQTHAQ